MICGTVKVEWSIDERGLNVAHIQRELTKAELLALYDRIEECLIGAIGGDYVDVYGDYVDVYIDGEEKPPVRVHIDMRAGMNELEIDDGPVNGRIEDLRNELESDEETPHE